MTLRWDIIVVCKSTLEMGKVAIQFLVLARAAPAFNSTGIGAPSEQMHTSELDCDFATHGVDFEGSQKWVDFWSAPGAQKSRWMLALGRQRGAKSPTTDGQALGGDILFEKMAPRARLVRAQLINKLIKLIN